MRPLPLGLWPLQKSMSECICGQWEGTLQISNLHPQRRRGNLIHTLIIPTQVGNPWHLQVELGNLADHELHQLMEDLCQEITHRELNAPPRSPPPIPWGHPSWSGNPNADDQEVTFLRGGGCITPGQSSPSPTLAQPDGGWVPQDHLLNLKFLLNLIQMWGA